MEKEITNKEILEAVSKLTLTVTETNQKIGGLEVTVNETNQKVGGLKNTVNDLMTTMNEYATSVEEQINDLGVELKKEISSINGTLATQIVTKEYLDDKLADLNGDLVLAIKTGDTKLHLTVDKLHKKKVFNENDRQEILALKPFYE